MTANCFINIWRYFSVICQERPPPRFHNVFNIQVHAVHFVLSFSQLKRNWRKTWDCSVKFGQIFVQKQWIIHLIQTKPNTAIGSDPQNNPSKLFAYETQTDKKNTHADTHIHTLSHTHNTCIVVLYRCIHYDSLFYLVC